MYPCIGRQIKNQIKEGVHQKKIINLKNKKKFFKEGVYQFASFAHLHGIDAKNLASGHWCWIRDTVLGEVENNSFIALPGKGGCRRLMPSKLCLGFGEEFDSNDSRVGLLIRISVFRACSPSIWSQVICWWASVIPKLSICDLLPGMKTASSSS